MSKHDDDFWGTTGDWTDSTPRRTPRTNAAPQDDAHRTRPIQIIRRGWSQMLSGGANATRSHGITRPAVPAALADEFDEFDDFRDVREDAGTSYAYGDAPTERRQPIGPGPLIVPVEEPSRELTRELARSFSDFDFDDDVAAPRAGRVNAGRVNAGPRVRAHVPAEPNEHGDWSSWDDEFEPVAAGGALDPLLGKLGALAVVGALTVPLLFNLSSDAGDTLADTVAALPPAPVSSLAAEPIVEPGAPVQLSADPDTGTASADAPAPAGVPADAAQLSTATATAAAPAADSASTQGAAPAAEANVAAAAAEPVSRAADNGALDTAPADVPAAADTPADRVERICATDYDVLAGDYWIRLADGAGVPLAELLEANGASASTPLFPGATICLPAGSKTPPPPTTAPATTAPATSAPATTAPATTAPATTTTTTTTTPTTVPAAPGDVKQIIRNVWPDELEERALEIAYRESRYVPTAKNYCCYGIFQIYWNVHKSWLDDIGITDDQQLYDPETNARAAYALYQRAGGWGPWSL